MNYKITAIKAFCGKILGFAESQIATGTNNLINDVTSWLYVLVPLAGVVFLIYFSIRRGSADQQDKKQWDDRIKTVIVSVIIGLLATVIVNIITSYYGTGG